MSKNDWYKAREYTPEKMEIARQVLALIREGANVFDIIRKFPLKNGGYVAKHVLVAAYREMVDQGEIEPDENLLARIRMKPVRTLSGVTTVTVLTKPYACPGKCIFCPTDVRMPKSYLPDEPGAARAFQNDFDPYEQTVSRIKALEAVGHPTEKIELLILGGSWDAYPRDYQEWFIKRCYDAMNEVESETLPEAQQLNETGPHRNVGLVIETRPDLINPQQLAHLRYLGVTKVQMGAQSLNDKVLEMNCRGHSAAETLRATSLLRAAGFKIVLHWMPNLLGATPESDREDFYRLWDGFCPDELKIYPTQLLENAELYKYWQRGEYKPYSTEELVSLIADVKPSVEPYCRINRVIRDISSTHVVEGNKRTSLRMDVLEEIKRRGQVCRCIRCREVRKQKVDPQTLQLTDYVYQAAYAEEHFLSFVTSEDKIAGYLRLSLPAKNGDKVDLGFKDLQDAAIIREVHVYGQSLPVGGEQTGAAQHIGLGTSLLEKAEEITRQMGYSRLAVIAAVGTRLYYESRGFERGELYLVKPVQDADSG